jgi:hypothetical protein
LILHSHMLVLAIYERQGTGGRTAWDICFSCLPRECRSWSIKSGHMYPRASASNLHCVMFYHQLSLGVWNILFSSILLQAKLQGQSFS